MPKRHILAAVVCLATASADAHTTGKSVSAGDLIDGGHAGAPRMGIPREGSRGRTE